MKKILFFALALLMTACEKIILDEDISGKKDANVILHFTQYETSPLTPLQRRGELKARGTLFSALSSH